MSWAGYSAALASSFLKRMLSSAQICQSCRHPPLYHSQVHAMPRDENDVVDGAREEEVGELANNAPRSKSHRHWKQQTSDSNTASLVELKRMHACVDAELKDSVEELSKRKVRLAEINTRNIRPRTIDEDFQPAENASQMNQRVSVPFCMN